MALMLELGHSTHHTSGGMRQLGCMFDDIVLNNNNEYAKLFKPTKFFMEVYINLVQRTKQFM